MIAANRVAFKEWAVICAALGDGQQTMILRKGGIQEGAAGFRVEHDEFWLFPTYEHQKAEELTDAAWPLLREIERNKTAADPVRLAIYAVVNHVIEIRDPIVLPSLAGLHLWSDRTVSNRFGYKRPGLFLLIVRAYRAGTAFELPNSPHFAGCRSWVELPAALPTAELKPVLDDAAFSRQRAQIMVAASPIRLA